MPTAPTFTFGGRARIGAFLGEGPTGSIFPIDKSSYFISFCDTCSDSLSWEMVCEATPFSRIV